MKSSPLLLTFCALVSFTQLASCARILFVFPISSRSESHLFLPLAKELALKGHSITYVTSTASNLKIKDFQEIVPIRSLDMSDFFSAPDPIEGRRLAQNKLAFFLSINVQFIFDNCHKVYNNTEFQSILRQSFDLLIFSANFNNCFQGLVHKFQAPFILLNSVPVAGYISENTGLRMPSSFVPNQMLEFTDTMPFKQRLVNVLMNWAIDFLHKYQLAPSETAIYRHYLGQDYPDLLSIQSNVSLIFGNSHIGINTARPTLPDIVEIGGIHCRNAQPLPKELDEWLSAEPNGFIFFSLGTCVKGVTLPEATRKLFLNVFSRLKLRVLWKWETEQMDDLPPNVKLAKWLPQQDVLGHKNIKLFISHGGLLSTQEATYHGVRVIGIPFYVDQDVNMLQAEKMGYSIRLEILELTEEKLEIAINQILSDPKYLQNALKASNIFRDRAQGPLQTAVYWTEYILRHKGAPQLRSAARNLNDIQYFCVDVLLFLTVILLFSLWIIIQLVKVVCVQFRQKKISQFDQEEGTEAEKKRN